MGMGESPLQGWFVREFYQEHGRPQLFAARPSAEAKKLTERTRRLALSALPETPPHTGVGRSLELLALEQLLAAEPYAVVRGIGGAGKTTIAVELACWPSCMISRCPLTTTNPQFTDNPIHFQ